MNRVVTLGLAFLLVGCTAANGDRLSFCDATGQKIDGIFLNLQTGEMVLNDVVLHGTLDCGRSDLCFDPVERVFRYRSVKSLSAQREIEVPIDWGKHAWVVTPAEGQIRFQASDWSAENCQQIELQLVRSERN